MVEPVALIFENNEKLVIGVTEYFNTIINNKTSDISVALSGGSTPKIWFEYLAEYYSENIDWKRIHLYWGDERCVPPDHNESNYGMTKSYLLDHINIPAENIHRIQGEINPVDAATIYSNELNDHLPGDKSPIFDLILLGMGDDGHTASIFPHEMELWNSDKNCVVATHPVSGQKRVSISGEIINSARSVVFLVAGQNKAEKVAEIMNSKPNASNYPAHLVNPYEGELFWFLDADAASQLDHDQ